MNAVLIGLVAFLVGVLLGGATAPRIQPMMNAPAPVSSNQTHMMPDGTMMGGAGMDDMMESMNAQLKGKSGDAFDQAFLAEMIVHHQGAVEMAEQALSNAGHQEIKDLANAIISAQNKEIAQMKSWQKSWYGISQ